MNEWMTESYKYILYTYSIYKISREYVLINFMNDDKIWWIVCTISWSWLKLTNNICIQCIWWCIKKKVWKRTAAAAVSIKKN